MKKNVKSAKISQLHDKSASPIKLKTDLTKFPKILPRYVDAAHRGSVLLCFFFIYFGCMFENFYGIYIIGKQGYKVPKSVFGGITKKRIKGSISQLIGKCAGQWRFGTLTPHEFCYLEGVTHNRV